MQPVSQWCGLRPLILGQDRSETKKSVLVLHAVVLVLYTAVLILVLKVLHIWCCFVKHDLVMLVVIMKVKDTATFQVLLIVSLFCVWNITTVEINSGIFKSAKCLCLLPVVFVLFFRSRSCMQRSWSWSCYFSLDLGLVLLFWSWSCKQQSWSCYVCLGLKNLVLFT